MAMEIELISSLIIIELCIYYLKISYFMKNVKKDCSHLYPIDKHVPYKHYSTNLPGPLGISTPTPSDYLEVDSNIGFGKGQLYGK